MTVRLWKLPECRPGSILKEVAGCQGSRILTRRKAPGCSMAGFVIRIFHLPSGNMKEQYADSPW